MMSGRMLRFVQTCVDAAFPTRCRQCEELYFRRRRQTAWDGIEKGAVNAFGSVMADYLCSRCADLYEPVTSPLCCKCGTPFKSDHGLDHECPDCFERPFAFETARAAGVFNPTLRTLIHQYKYHGSSELARPLGRLLWDALHRFYGDCSYDLILPVPLHWFRRYRRGFNQAALLLRQWSKLALEQSSPIAPIPIADNVLVRVCHTPAQAGLGRKQRLFNLETAFAVTDHDAVRNRHILLIDDVLTTGSTAQACAKVLLSAGAAAVSVLTVARAIT
jgi:ComF family protein